MIKYKEKRAIHPGYYIKQIIDDTGVTQDDFAARLGITSKMLSELVNGKIKLSDDVAIALSCMLGTSIDLWTNLQKQYQNDLNTIKQSKIFDQQKAYLDMINYQYFVVNAGITYSRDARERIHALCSCLQISSLCYLDNPVKQASYRIGAKTMEHKNIVCAHAWLRFAIMQGSNNRIVGKVNLKMLEQAIPEIRGMTIQGVSSSMERLKEIFNACGVTFICLPMLKDAKISGAVKWSADNKSVTLAINDRGKKEDVFWFTLFHEIRHVMQCSYTRTYISMDDMDAVMDEQDADNEKDADKFAMDTLIPRDKYIAFIKKGDFSVKAIKAFSASIGIHDGITAGRLAKDGYVDYAKVNNLRKSFRLQ